MVNRKKSFPEKGDRVLASGWEGAFVVYLVDESLQTADLQQIGSDLRLATIPWTSLTVSEEDAKDRKSPAKFD